MAHCGFRCGRPQPVVLAHAPRVPENQWVLPPTPNPSPAPWSFAERLYGISHCLVDRDGRVIGTHLPIGNGPLIEQAPAMADLLRELVTGVPPEQLRERAAHVLQRIDAWRSREPGDDDE